jgi:hypothetical protein
MTTLRESLIERGLLVPAEQVEPRPYVPIDLGLPLLRLKGDEGKHKAWMPPDQGDIKP